jgi:hypothetical protein
VQLIKKIRYTTPDSNIGWDSTNYGENMWAQLMAGWTGKTVGKTAENTGEMQTFHVDLLTFCAAYRFGADLGGHLIEGGVKVRQYLAVEKEEMAHNELFKKRLIEGGVNVQEYFAEDETKMVRNEFFNHYAKIGMDFEKECSEARFNKKFKNSPMHIWGH